MGVGRDLILQHQTMSMSTTLSIFSGALVTVPSLFTKSTVIVLEMSTVIGLLDELQRNFQLRK